MRFSQADNVGHAGCLSLIRWPLGLQPGQATTVSSQDDKEEVTMQRIDTGVSTQLGDISRPRQTAQDQANQARESRRVEQRPETLSGRGS